MKSCDQLVGFECFHTPDLTTWRSKWMTLHWTRENELLGRHEEMFDVNWSALGSVDFATVVEFALQLNQVTAMMRHLQDDHGKKQILAALDKRFAEREKNQLELERKLLDERRDDAFNNL
ncbi:MAG: hypothetical protein Q8K86_05025 [Candidatus Nanopelagicaceae bacterium]|nr:hypothetical protein [Candidatus Nanopelagicaceae bacterium]